MNKWEYKGFYKKYNMRGIIDLPNNSKIKVCDLILEMPDFMKEADIIFCDPPCNQGNLTSFYTKANQQNLNEYKDFYNALFKRIDEINPRLLFLEVFKNNIDLFLKECEKRYLYVNYYNSMYYNNKKNKCWIIQATNEKIYYPELENLDEEKTIKWICKNINFTCIGDLCMGKGLVGKYAYLNNKKFVGIELNKKRLALLIDFIKNDIKN